MYDTIVIGNDLGSLIAATVLSHHGVKTALVSESDAQYTFSESGFTFNIDPSPITGFGPEQTCSRLAADLGISITQCMNLRLLNPGFQIIMPDHRVDFFCGKEELFKELQREFPDHMEDVRKLYAPVLKINDIITLLSMENLYIFPKSFKEMATILRNIPKLILQWLLLSKASRKIKTNHLGKLIEVENALLSNFYVNSDTRTKSIPSTYALSAPLRGLYYSMGGNEFLLRSIKARFENSGGRLLKNCSVIRINAGKKIDVDVQSPDTLAKIEGRYLIVSTKWEKLGMLLLNNRRYKRLERRLTSVKSLSYPFTLHIGVLDSCVPEKMAAYVAVIVDHDTTIMDNNFVFIETSAASDAKRAPEGSRALSATVYLKASPLVLSDEVLRNVSSAVLRSLETFLPFLQASITFINIDKSIELSRKYQEMVNQKYSMRYCPVLGVSRLSKNNHVHNVYMTGGMLLAGFGFEGEVISGINTACSIISREGKKHGHRTN